MLDVLMSMAWWLLVQDGGPGQPLGQGPSDANGDGAAGGAAIGGALFLGFICCFSLAALGLTIFWIWSLIDCAQRDFPSENDKLIWILVIVFTGFIGSAIYVLIGRSKATKPPAATKPPPPH